MITQGSTQSDLQGVLALLEVISNPDKAKKRLTELLVAAKQAQEDEQAAVDAEAKAQKVVDKAIAIEKKQDTKEFRLNELDAALQNDKFNIQGDRVKFERDAAEARADIAEKQRVYLANVAAFEASSKDITARLVEKEKVVALRETTAQKLVAEYTQKLAQLKQLAL